jgi:hypothetical protein
MKNHLTILVVLIITLAFTACEKVPKASTRYIGEMYNINDSLPFKNTKFRITTQSQSIKSNFEDVYLYTDSLGHFDNTNNILVGHLCWPSYYPGAVYLGPSPFTPLTAETDLKTNITTAIYKVYTLPFH